MNWRQRFPIDPYPLQIEFARTLYDALNDGTKLCFMESPTGTGKSYSLLVGLCTWLEANRFSVQQSSKAEGKSMPNWLKKAADVTKQSEVRQQQRHLQQRLLKIRDNHISSVKTRKMVGKTITPVKSEESDESDKEVLQEQEKHQNGKRAILLKTLQNQQSGSYSRPRIIFTSRTHSQLTQIVQSFRKLKSELICCALASKKHMCINPQVKCSADVDSNCQRLLDRSKCSFYTKQSYGEFVGLSVNEAEALGDKYAVCPYYASKGMIQVADVICVPYASIMRSGVRQRLGLHLRNSIIVFDEGHNVVQYDLSSRSTELTYNELCVLHSRLTAYIEKYSSRLKPKSKYLLDHMSSIITELLTLLKTKLQQLPKNNTAASYTKCSFVELLIQLKTTEIEFHRLKTFVELNNLSNRLYFISKDGKYDAGTLQRFLDFFDTVIFDNSPDSIIVYKFPGAKSSRLNETSVKTMLFEAKSVNDIVSQAKMCVFAGGTLHPLSELQQVKTSVPSCVSKQFEHIIPVENCKVLIVESYRGTRLLFNHKNKQNKEHLNAIKELIRKVQSIEKEGIIVFLQSYKYLQLIRDSIKNEQFYACCHFDSKESSGDLFKEYQHAINLKKQAILFSVMGGRLSEGINFSDELARALLIFGLPYSDPSAPEIAERMAYYDRKQLSITGKQYYQNLCMRIVNQTIGRAIRHKNDRAIIYLIDQRFAKSTEKLSKWLRNRCQRVPDGDKIK